MEQVENPMIMPQYEYNTDFDRYYEAMTEKEDLEYEDNFKEEF